MTFPTYAGATTTAKGTAGTSHAITLPSSSSGDVLIAIFGTDGAPTHTWPGDWADSVFTDTANGSDCKVSGRWKISDGSETLTITTGSSVQSSAQVLRFTAGFSATTPVVGGATVTGSSTNPNPPACTPGGSAQDFFWVSGFLADDDDETGLYFTSGYTGIGQVQSNAASADSCLLSMQYIQNNNTTNNPASMAMAASEEWVAFNFAVSPVTISDNNAITLPSPPNVAVAAYAVQATTTEKHFITLPSPPNVGIAAFAPTVTATDNNYVTLDSVPGIAVATFAPTVTTTENNHIQVPLALVSISANAVTATTTEHNFSIIPAAELTLEAFAVEVTTSEADPGGHVVELPSTGVVLQAYPVTVTTTGEVEADPITGFFYTFKKTKEEEEKEKREAEALALRAAKSSKRGMGAEGSLLYQGTGISAEEALLLFMLAEE